MNAGPVGFAAGAQWREESYSATRNELYTQSIDPATGETIPVDLIFLGGGLPIDESRDSYALFAEANFPLTSSLEANIAVRYEDLSSDSSLDPKLALRWQATEGINLSLVVNNLLDADYEEAVGFPGPSRWARLVGEFVF